MGHRTAFDFIGVQQARPGPAADGGGEFPAKVGGVADTEVGAEAAPRRVEVGGVAEQEAAPGTVAVGDEHAG
jgi:hypothetical protein